MTQTSIDWGQLTAIGTIVVAPMILVGLIVRKWLVTGPDARGGDGRMTNRAAVLTRAGEIVLEERATPTPGPREVLVEITSVGVCGSDIHYYEHGRIGPHVVHSPLILGPRVGGPRGGGRAPR